jgi:hypothetical protein
MANIRLIPPGTGKYATLPVNGRTYTCALGAFIDVPDFDANVLTANGWIRIAVVGTTAQRPTNPGTGMLYHDTTLGYVVVWEGAAWRNPNSGSVV